MLNCRTSLQTQLFRHFGAGAHDRFKELPLLVTSLTQIFSVHCRQLNPSHTEFSRSFLICNSHEDIFSCYFLLNHKCTWQELKVYMAADASYTGREGEGWITLTLRNWFGIALAGLEKATHSSSYRPKCYTTPL